MSLIGFHERISAVTSLVYPHNIIFGTWEFFNETEYTEYIGDWACRPTYYNNRMEMVNCSFTIMGFIRTVITPVIFLLGEFVAGQTYYDYDYDYDDDDKTDMSGEAERFGNSVYGGGENDTGHDTISPMDTAVIVLYSLIIIVGLIANAVVFFVVFAGHEMGKTVTTTYVLMLTIADSVFLITLPIFIFQKGNSWNFGAAMCTICQTIKFLNYYASIFFLTAMSIDRYIAVAYSTRLTQIRTKEQTCLICCLVWIMAILMTIPVMLYSKIENGHGATFCRVIFPGYRYLNETASFFVDVYSSGFGSESERESMDEEVIYYMPSGGNPILDERNGTYQYKCDFDLQPPSYKAWLVANFLISFAIPFIVIVAMYALILLHLCKAEQKIGQTATSRSVRTRRRVTKMVAALVVCFTICWLPHHILILARIQGFKSTVSMCYGLEELFSALAFSNSALNPILYTFLGNNFKERFRKSVHNTQLSVRQRTSVNGSGFRRSLKSISGVEIGRKKNASVVIYRKTSSLGSSESSSNEKRKKSQITLLSTGKKDGQNSEEPSVSRSLQNKRAPHRLRIRLNLQIEAMILISKGRGMQVVMMTVLYP